MTQPRGRGAIGLRAIWAQVAAAYRSHFWTLLGLALVVFVPLGLLDALDDSLERLDTDELDDLEASAVLVAIGAHGLTALLGNVFYSGAVAAVIAKEPSGERHPLLGLLRPALLLRLVLVDVLFGIGVMLGFLLFVVPGLIVFTRFALAGPSTIEGIGVRAAFARSRELVRGRAWTVFWIVVPIIAAGDALATGAQSGALWALGDSLLGDWVGATASWLLLSPLYALVVTVLFLELRERRSPSAALS